MPLSPHRLRTLASVNPAFDISVAGGTCRAIAAFLCLLWLLIMIAATWGKPGSMDALLGGLWATQSSLIVLSCLLMQSGLAEAQRVLHARAAPRHALAASLAALHRLGWQIWALAALPLLMDSARRLVLNKELAAGLQLGAGPAWLALLMLLCAWSNAAWQGRLKPWAGLIGLGAALLALQAWAAPALLSGSYGAAAALASQVLLLWIAPRLARQALSLPQGRYRGAGPFLSELAQAWASKFQMLDKSAQSGNWLPFQIIWLSSLSQPWVSKIFWSPQLSLGSFGLRQIMLCMLALLTLQCHQLHWRHLLAPSGAVRQNLGLHITLSTLQAYLRCWPLLAPLLVIVLVIHWLVTPSASLGTLLLQHGPAALWLGLDITLATVLAVLLRGSLRSQQLALLTLAAPFALGLLALLWAPSRWALTQSLPRDATWLALELGLILSLLPWLGRAWRGVDLGALMQRNEAALAKRRQNLAN